MSVSALAPGAGRKILWLGSRKWDLTFIALIRSTLLIMWFHRCSWHVPC
jgi:hypothetical protein